MIIGGNGQIGWDLQRSMASLGTVITLNRRSKNYPIDLTQADTIKAALSELKPDIIINASAYTAVDKAEDEKDIARQINTNAVSVLVEQANTLNALLVHYSTDYVFDGKTTTPYSENHKPAPINVYGQTKLDGDLAILANAKNYLIFRTSWVYTNRASNFMLTMLNLTKQRKELNIIDDQIGSPTWSRLIADVTSKAVYAKYNFSNEIESGLYNLSGQGETSWYGFAKKIFEYANLDGSINVLPITTENYPTPAKRPVYTVLSNEKLERTFSLKIPMWQDSLKLCMDEYLAR